MPDPNNNQTVAPPPMVNPIVDVPPMPDLISTNQQSGSSAPPVSFPNLPIDEPKKKFGGGKGKIIATILGILLLVGGVGTGAYLVLQNQNPNERAATASCSTIGNSIECNKTCSPIKTTDGKSYACKWLSATSKCSESAQLCGGDGNPAPAEIDCSSSTPYVNAYGTTYAYCAGCNYKCVRQDLLVNGGCNVYLSNKCGAPINYGGVKCSTTTNLGGQICSTATNTGCITPSGGIMNVFFDKTGICNHFNTTTSPNDGLCAMYPGCIAAAATPGGSATDTWSCNSSGCTITSGTKCTVYRYTCNSSVSGTCLDNPEGPAKSFSFATSGCGIKQQIDVSCGSTTPADHVTKIFPACTPKPTAQPTPTKTPSPTPTPTKSPSPTPTPSPSPTPLVTAQCQNVTAYSPTWTVLTATQLSQKKAGDVVNFCVVGSASAGIFDKAKFTINTTAQAETTTKRPNTQDFCQSYTIPANTYTFNVTAQIHHATLGWK